MAALTCLILTMALLEKQPDDRVQTAESLVKCLELPRSQWPMQVGSYASSSMQETQAITRPAAGRGGSRYWGWVTAGLFGLFGFGMWLFAPQIIRIATNQGELVIETEDENVQVEVRENGDLIRVLDASSGASFDVRSGNFEISAIGKDGKAEFQVKPNQLRMSRGDREVVRVTLAKSAEVPSAQHAGSTALPPSRFVGPATDLEPVESAEAPDIGVFRGKDFAAWMRVLQNDQDPTTQAQALNACATLYSSAGRYQELSSLLNDYLNRHAGFKKVNSKQLYPELYSGFIGAFEKLSAEGMIDFLALQLKQGSQNSIEWALYGLFSHHDLQNFRFASLKIRSPQVQEELKKRAEELLDLSQRRSSIGAAEAFFLKVLIEEGHVFEDASSKTDEAVNRLLVRLPAAFICVFLDLDLLPNDVVEQRHFDPIKKELFSKETRPKTRDQILAQLLMLKERNLREKYVFVQKLIAEVIANQIGTEPIEFDKIRKMKVYANSLDVEQATEFKGGWA